MVSQCRNYRPTACQFGKLVDALYFFGLGKRFTFGAKAVVLSGGGGKFDHEEIVSELCLDKATGEVILKLKNHSDLRLVLVGKWDDREGLLPVYEFRSLCRKDPFTVRFQFHFQ